MSKRYNILISANHCAPNKGSEHGVGWNFVSRLSEYHNITLITNKHIYFNELTDAASELGIKVYGIKQYVKFKGLTKLFPFFYYTEYRWWQYRVYRKAKKLHTELRFDLTHQITNITFREPGYLWKLNIHFVWGPVVVLGNEKPKFLNMYGFSEGLKIILRHISFKIQYSFSGCIKKALNVSSACLPVCKNTLNLLHNLSTDTNFYIMPETASIDENITDVIYNREQDEEIRLLWISRFDPSKGVMFLLQALNLLPDNIKYKLILAGDGPQRNKAIAFCNKNNISYEYLGSLPFDETQKLYATAHLFFITSMMDATTSVLFESLSNGLPVVALDHLSFGEKVDDSCGRKIKVGTPEQIVLDIADTIKYYYTNESSRRKASEGAVIRAKENSWNTRIRELNKLYAKILNTGTR
jgi:Glycosyltransferase